MVRQKRTTVASETWAVFPRVVTVPLSTASGSATTARATRFSALFKEGMTPRMLTRTEPGRVRWGAV
jgi:hypothetical protein